MNKRKKIVILTASSLSAAGLLGMTTGVVTNIILNSHSNVQTVGDPVELSSILTITNLGTVPWGVNITPNSRQLNSILKIANNPSGSQDDNWHPNQWTFNNINVSTPSVCTAQVKVVDWSPDYKTDSGNVVNIQWAQQNPTTPITLNQAFNGTDNVVNLNSSYATWLSTQSAVDVSSLKGIDNQTNLLKWLDASTLYNGALDINQIKIDDVKSSTGLQWNDAGDDVDTYSVNLLPIDYSNMYTGEIKVVFNVGRINFSSATITNMSAGGALAEDPSDLEIFSWFMETNKNAFGTKENIVQEDVNFGTYSQGGRTLSVKQGNEYWTGIKQITYSVEPTGENLETVVPGDKRVLSFIEKPTFADFMQALDANLDTAINWDAILLPSGCNWNNVSTWNDWQSDGTFTLEPIPGNLFYTGSVTITWSTSY